MSCGSVLVENVICKGNLDESMSLFLLAALAEHGRNGPHRGCGRRRRSGVTEFEYCGRRRFLGCQLSVTLSSLVWSPGRRPLWLFADGRGNRGAVVVLVPWRPRHVDLAGTVIRYYRTGVVQIFHVL